MTQYPDIRVRKKTDGKVDWWEVAEDCRVDDELIIPAGYVSDFASVPRWLWSVLPPHGRLANASVVHDYMYDNRIGEQDLGATKARLLADIAFLWNAVNDNVPVFQSMFVFLIVRTFGRKWWKV